MFGKKMKEYISVNPVEFTNEEFSSPVVRVEVQESIYTPFKKSQILFAVTESGKNAVIKIPANSRRASREWLGLKKAYKAGVPVPEPLALAITQAGTSALVSGKIEGSTLYKKTGSHLRYEVGLAVSRMHERTTIKGKEWIASNEPTFVYYDRTIFGWLTSVNELLNAGSKTQEAIKSFSTSASSYCETAVPVFNHNDLHDGQVMVRAEGGIALLDFENWTENTRLNEIAYYLFHTIRTSCSPTNYAAFLEGYLGDRCLTEDDKSILSFYLLFISARALNYFVSTQSKFLDVATNTHNRVLKYTDEERLWKDY